jgi:hypothetical protein
MNGEIALSLSLVAYANAFLQGEDVAFDRNHSTAKFCKFIEFIEIPGGVDSLTDRIILAEDPISWFRLLKKQGVEYVLLHYYSSENSVLSDRISSTFSGGGGRWVIEAVKDNASDLWEAGWLVGSSKGDRIWEVYYILFSKDCNRPDYDYPAMDEVYEILRQCLNEIYNFALSHVSTAHFAKYYQQCIEFLSSENPFENFDILPDGYILRAQQLVRACYTSWLFGGMGSWNDIVFEDDITQQMYNKVSDNLYIAICIAIVVAVNSFVQNLLQVSCYRLER